VPSGAAAAWPTEPPAAGSGDTDTWPTTAPERDDEPAIHEPPPSELEAYPAAPAQDDDAATDAAVAGAAAATAAHSVPEAESATGESTQCPRCGTENRPGLSFCRNCGQRLIAAGVASTVERPGAPEGTMACPRCGTHNRAGVAFCQNCGANLRGTAPGYVPPAVAASAEAAPAETTTGGAVLGPVVLLIGMAGVLTGYLLPFLYGSGSLFERAWSSGGYGIAFWSGYPEVGAALADQAYFGLAAPIPLLALLLLGLAIAGFLRAVPGPIQIVGLVIALLWSVGLIILFLVVELAGNWSGDLVGMLRVLTPAGIILFLSSLIIVIGTLTRFSRS
jgi:Double zinc ribbon